MTSFTFHLLLPMKLMIHFYYNPLNSWVYEKWFVWNLLGGILALCLWYDVAVRAVFPPFECPRPHMKMSLLRFNRLALRIGTVCLVAISTYFNQSHNFWLLFRVLGMFYHQAIRIYHIRWYPWIVKRAWRLCELAVAAIVRHFRQGYGLNLDINPNYE